MRSRMIVRQAFFLTAAVLLMALFSLAQSSGPIREISIRWKGGQPQGQIQVDRGTLVGTRVSRGQGAAHAKDRFQCGQPGPCRLEVQIQGAAAQHGPASTLVTVATIRNPFTFFLANVNRAYPIFIPAYGVAVTTSDDPRSYDEIATAIQASGLQTKLQKIESEPEESFETAAPHVRDLRCQTWLGLSRDMRIFGVSERLDWIQPRFHGYEVSLPEAEDAPARYNFLVGRGWGAREDITRRLEEGVLPILRGRLVDEDISYEITAFVSLESSPLRADTLRGTHFLVADGHGRGHMFTPEQKALYESRLEGELNQPQETVLYLEATALNTSSVPRYAFFKTAWPSTRRAPEYSFDLLQAVWPVGRWFLEYSFDGKRGFGLYKTDKVFAVSRLNREPLSEEEVAILLEPGESTTLEIFLPHRPISANRAAKLAGQDFSARHVEVREFWRHKLNQAAKIQLPETRIEEMLAAGLLHLDLVAYGLEPDGSLMPSIGIYNAIGSESSPIVQFMDSMGWHEVARRALMYFLDKQHEDGLIQNFGSYMLETGAALWSMGEHYRYTRDAEWVREIAPKLIKSCEYLRRSRERNRREELKGKGFGMIEGKTADPEDPFHSFMLNGYAYLGLSRSAEMLREVDPAEAERWQAEAEGLKQDIRSALFAVMGKSPVIPLGDGTWCPTVPPWVEYRGPVLLFGEGGNWFSHGTMTTRDSLLGPVYLIFQEVLDPSEAAARFLLESHNELMTNRNVIFSQPYYSRHPVSHLRRGEVKAFLKGYYNTMASLADRQTYTFWEHYFGASPHKTHEEGWFLMSTRWMLYMERGDRLELLPGVPRSYFKDGNEIKLEGVASYFGPIDLRVVSHLQRDFIEATVECATERKPKTVELRLPHPVGRQATWVEGGSYDPVRERVRVENFTGQARIVLGFDGPR